MFIIVLIIPVIISWFTYQGMLRGYIEQVKKTHLALLIQTREIIDNYMTSIEWKVFNIGEKQRLKELLRLSANEIGSVNYKIREFINEFSSYFYDEDLTTTCYIYLKKSDTVITPDTSFSTSLFNRESVFEIRGSTVQSWNNNLSLTYFKGLFLPSIRIKSEMITHSEYITYIPYIHSLPVLSFTDRPEGAIVFLISEQKIENLIRKFNIPPGGRAYITDNRRTIITSVTGNTAGKTPRPSFKRTFDQQEGIIIEERDGLRMVSIYTTSPKNDWKYVVTIPYQYLIDQLGFSNNIIMWLLVSSFVFSIIIALYLAYENSKPLQKVITMMGEFFGQDTPKKDYPDLQGGVAELIKKSRGLKEALDRQSDFVQKTFFNRLIKGGFKNREEIDAGLSFARMRITGEKFLICIIALSGYEDRREKEIFSELQMTKVVIANIISNTIGGNCHIHDMDEERMAVLLAFSDMSDSACFSSAEKSIQTIYDNIREVYVSQFHIAVSGLARNLLEINKAMEEAIEALNVTGKSSANPVIWFHQLSEKIQDYYYPLEIEMRFMNVVKAGDIDQANAILDTIAGVNLNTLRLSRKKCDQLMMEIHGTFIKLKNHIDIDSRVMEMIRHITEIEEPEEAFGHIKKLTGRLCKMIDEKKKSHNTALSDNIVHYLDENYSNSQLSLYSVSSRFGLTEVYLSCFFKEQTGVNFSWYLEKLRIDHATRLLSETSLTINEIAQKVGYSSDKAFRRAFKRVTNIPPTKLRLLQKRAAPS
ncbi:MAG: helix-turn-helix domain-containing protein [Spirochaetales bacterium]|nr:helix-turn-helix domain-containing protein [Spirochaetales bacterium]